MRAKVARHERGDFFVVRGGITDAQEGTRYVRVLSLLRERI